MSDWPAVDWFNFTHHGTRNDRFVHYIRKIFWLVKLDIKQPPPHTEDRPNMLRFPNLHEQSSKPLPSDSRQFPSEPHTRTGYWSTRWLSSSIGLPLCGALPSVTVAHAFRLQIVCWKPPPHPHPHPLAVHLSRTGTWKGNLQHQPHTENRTLSIENGDRLTCQVLPLLSLCLGQNCRRVIPTAVQRPPPTPTPLLLGFCSSCLSLGFWDPH